MQLFAILASSRACAGVTADRLFEIAHVLKTPAELHDLPNEAAWPTIALNAACIRPCALQSKRACTSAPPKSSAKKFARNICCRGVLASISRSRWQCGHRTFNASSRRPVGPTAAIGIRLNTPARSLLRDHGNLHRRPTHQLCNEMIWTGRRRSCPPQPPGPGRGCRTGGDNGEAGSRWRNHDDPN